MDQRVNKNINEDGFHKRVNAGLINDGHASGSDHNVPSYSKTDDEKSKLLPGEPPKIYARRWYVLFLYCMTTVLQGLSWSSIGPIASTVVVVFEWTDGIVAGTFLAGTSMFIINCIPFSWLMEHKGMRWSMLISATMMTAGFCVRCITMYAPGVAWTMTISTALVGGGAVVPVSGVSLIASLWFPLSQRTTATSIATIFGLMGSAAGFLVGPMVVPEFNPNNDTLFNSTENATLIEHQRDAIGKLMYYEAGFAVLVLLAVIIYFPAKPPSPPTYTAKQKRLNIVSGLKSLVKNRSFLMVLIAASAAPGVSNALNGILPLVLEPLKVSEKTAGWMGFYSTVGGFAGGFLSSWLSDRFMKRHKIFILAMLIPSACFFVWFLLLVVKVLPYNINSLYVATVVPGIFLNSVLPLFFDLACEASYPTGEAITALSLTMTNTIIAVLFFGILAIPGIGVVWMTYLLVIASFVTVITLFFTKVDYNRTDLDIQEEEAQPPNYDEVTGGTFP